MAGPSINRIPLYAIVLPALGLLTWFLVGKTESALLAIVLAVVLLGNVISAVHHAEVIALRIGEPFGTLVLALAVTVIEVGMIVVLMVGGEPNPALMRDSIHAVVMLVLHGLAGLCIVVCALYHREPEFHVAGANAFLAVLIPMAVLVLVMPNYVASAPGPFYSNLQLIFVSVVCLLLYGAFLFVQTGWHRAYFQPVGDDDTVPLERPAPRIVVASFGLLLVALVSVVLLAKSLTPALGAALAVVQAPVAVIGIVIAAIVLLPESVAAVRAAARNRLQSSLNLALGSGVASIGLTVPAVAVVSRVIDQPLELGISSSNSVLLALGVLIAVITYGTGRTNVLAGVVHLVLLAAYLFLTFVP
ncbi:MAG: ionic transporter y4hA [Reyranella sp.]|uniref:calcium:proton antiporter n=1 Tax=Reyranella sp. TaxID=1929291 RepID=UPI001AD1CE44|nr:ionic transporter y4hA [Reyranella sp.]MBN9085948.1 ionic transporter y4hA [Reyranella sp.]